MRLCFASPSHDEIREGIAVLAEVCRKEFGVPERSANIERSGTREADDDGAAARHPGDLERLSRPAMRPNSMPGFRSNI